jgi:cellulose synthase/poly-beta-1,6-N-acetylglucosamine synthase-like glycosyltransferase
MLLAIVVTCFAALVYTWIGYPLLVLALRSLRRPFVSASLAPRSRVSVVLATRDDDAAIRDRIADLARTSYPRELLDVVVALDAARQGAPMTQLGAVDFPVRIVQGDQPGGKAAALNAAVRAATGDILVFADTAQRFAPNAIAELVGSLESDQALGATSGALHIDAKGSSLSPAVLYWRYERWLRSSEARIHSAVGVTGAIYAMRRDLWAALPKGLILDDLYAPMQVVLRGFRVGFCDAAIATDARRFTPKDEYRRKARTLTGVLQLCAWLPSVLSPFRNPVWLQFVSHKLLRLATPYLLIVMALFVTASVLAGAGGRVALSLIALIVLAAIALPLTSRRIREAAVGTLLIQAAVMKATFNGLRGEWDVWHK